MARFAASLEVPPVPTADPTDLPGPTGESNRLSAHPRGPIACLGPDARTQADTVTALGGIAFIPDPRQQADADTVLGGVPDIA